MTQTNPHARHDGLVDYAVSWKQVSQAQVTVEFVTELETIVIDVLPGMSISGHLHGDVIFSVDGEEHHRVPVVALSGTGAAKRIADDYALHLGVRIGAKEAEMKTTLRLRNDPQK